MIVRKTQTGNFTIISNAILRNENLSWEARGVLSYILSFPDGWKLNTKHLVKSGGISEDGKNRCGSEKMYRIINELKTAGYIVGQATRENGSFRGYDYTVFDTPQIVDNSEEIVDNSPETALPEVGNAEPVKAETIPILNYNNTNTMPENKSPDKIDSTEKKPVSKKKPVLTPDQREVYDYMLDIFEKGYHKLNPDLSLPHEVKEFVALAELSKRLAGKKELVRKYAEYYYRGVFNHDKMFGSCGFTPSGFRYCLERIVSTIGGMSTEDEDALKYGDQDAKERVRSKAEADDIFGGER